MTTGYIPGWGMTARRCDTCRVAAALLYCRPHAAFLCGTCDSNVHDHDPTRSRHERVWICEVCEQAPASVTCKADAAALCATCDRDIHAANPLAGRHERVPVVPFFHSAADAAVPPSAFLASDEVACVVPPAPVKEVVENDWLIPNLKSEVLMADFMCNGSVMLDFGYDSQKLESQSFTFTDSVVPTKAETNLSFSDEIGNRIFENCCYDIDFSQPNKNQKLNHHQIFSGFNYSAQPSVSSSDIGVVPDSNPTTISEVSYTFTKSVSSAGTGDVDLSLANGAPVPAMDREARVMRYREKRKNRKFEKTIRYASRKAYAEKRPRIKGRFAKRTEKMEGSEIEQLYGFGSGFGSPTFDFETNGFGVVPFFD